MLVLDLGKTVKESLQKQGMLAWQYNTIGVSDAITMGGEGENLYNSGSDFDTDSRRNAVFSSDQRIDCRQYRDSHVRTTS